MCAKKNGKGIKFVAYGKDGEKMQVFGCRGDALKHAAKLWKLPVRKLQKKKSETVSVRLIRSRIGKYHHAFGGRIPGDVETAIEHTRKSARMFACKPESIRWSLLIKDGPCKDALREAFNRQKLTMAKVRKMTERQRAVSNFSQLAETASLMSGKDVNEWLRLCN